MIEAIAVIVGAAFFGYVLFKLNSAARILLFVFFFALHAVGVSARFVHKQLWHRRIRGYIPDFKPPLPPRLAAVLALLSLGVAGLAGWDFLNRGHPNQQDWITALTSTDLDASLLQEGVSVLGIHRLHDSLLRSTGVEVRLGGFPVPSRIRYYVFPDEQSSLSLFTALRVTKNDNPEWWSKHTTEYRIGESDVICLDRTDSGVGCFIAAADGVVVESRASRIDDDPALTLRHAKGLLEIGLWHWLAIADKVGW